MSRAGGSGRWRARITRSPAATMARVSPPRWSRRAVSAALASSAPPGAGVAAGAGPTGFPHLPRPPCARGWKRTPDGGRVAVAAIRRHRIGERFLADMLGYAWNEADRLAGDFEHDLPQEVEDRMFVALHRPATCPHGFPIPELEAADIPAMPPLYALEPGDIATVAVPGSTDPEVVAFLDTLGLRPGVTVEVREKYPFDGPLVLRVGGKDRTLGASVANQVFVTPV